MALVITTCTGSKTKAAAERHRFSALERAPVTELGVAWRARIASGERIPARSLYAGRAFKIPARIGAAWGARVLVVSAGLGLIDAEALVPPYDCTALSGEVDSVSARASDSTSPGAWWRIVQQVSPFALDFGQAVAAADGLVLAALSDAYLEMVSPDLLSLPAQDLARVRLFTRAPLDRVSAGLRGALMPYDDRLEGRDSGYRGTRDNFAARALQHFCECVLVSGEAASASDHAVAVERAIRGWRWPEKVKRRKASDAEIMTLMEVHWETTGGSASRLLKLFRHELLVQCEQGRCRALAMRVRERLA